MRALTLERWALDPSADTAGPSDQIPYAFTWTDTADPADMQPYAFHWDTGDPEEEDAAAPDWNAGFAGVASGLGTGAAIGTAVGTVFPGIGNAVGGAIGGAVGAIGGFFAGLFGGKQRGGRGKPKPTPSWVVDVLEEGRRALKEVPPNPSRMLDATLVAAGKLTREGYALAKRTGELPSQKYDRNRTAVMAKGRAMDKKFALQIEAHLQGLSLAEKALVSAAMPLGQGNVTLEAIRAIRARKESAARQKPAHAPPFFPPEVIERMRRQYLAQRSETERPSRLPEVATAPAPLPPPPPADDDAPELDRSELDTSGPSPVASAPTLETLPKPLWHVSMKAMPRPVFEWILYNVPALRQVPAPLLRAMAGKGPKVQDTSGVDAVTRQYVMMPGETFAGVAAQLTGDPARAAELHAANPRWTPERVRLEIPPGWLEWTPLVVPASGDTGDATSPAPDGEKTDGEKKESKPAPAASKDTERPTITKRTIEVLANDWPEKIAIRVGAKKIDMQWWKTLKSVNPHKAIAPNGNFQTLYAGELLNYPDTWPQHIEAKPAPGQVSLPSTTPASTPVINFPSIPGMPQLPWNLPGTIPAGATADFGVTVAAQATLVMFAKLHPEVASPQDYGSTITDLTGTQTERMRSVLSTFQLWWNTRNPSPMLRVDGALDPPTQDALRAYAVEGVQKLPIPLPSIPSSGTAYGGPAAPSGNTGPFPPAQSPGGSPAPPWSPGPLVVLNPPSSPVTASTTSTADEPHPKAGKDDGAAALMVGGTVLSLLLR